MSSLKELGNLELHEQSRAAAESEFKATLALLDHLAEADQRRLYSTMGYPSLRNYAVFELRISGSKVRNLIDAMRLMVLLPEVRDDFEQRSISLTTVAKLSRHLRRELADEARALLLLDQIQGKSSRMIDQILSQDAKHIEPKEMIRPLGQDTTRITVDVNQEFMGLISKARALKGNPNLGIREILQLALKEMAPQPQQTSLSTANSITSSSSTAQKLPPQVVIQLGRMERPKKNLLN